MRHGKKALGVIFYIVLAWLCYAFTVMAHEWTHGFMGWIWGYKSNPLNINYGGTGWRNLLYFANIREAINYISIGQAGHPYQAAFISIAAPLFANGGIMCVSGLYFKDHRFKKPIYSWLIFWLFIWNLGEFFSYFVQRCFSNHGDISGFLFFTQISGWYLFVPAFYSVIALMLYCFKTAIPKLCNECSITHSFSRRLLFIIIASVLFLFYAIRGLDTANNEITDFISILSMLFAPAVVYLTMPHPHQASQSNS